MPAFQDVVHKAIDANRYASKKTLAQGMLDIALLTANASQLKYILQVGKQHEFYTLMVTLISVSIVLQILVGVLFVVLGNLNINKEKDQRKADVINNITTGIIFVISLVNVIISGFGLDAKPALLQNLNREDIIEP
ncbi:ninjurin-1 isoform X3 [Neocloeon triangulifer]|uniref:ninjurin-1 isoform X3 n=1 Tax=Neocloeon triangulifer TaxID=2078957 RepID=UPI00286EC928|nr:ninjurin-1 isoform X3 [Neocloeon triangulifer]